ncbi:MAG: Ltp family lipoprotein [Lactobacillaceae bacterium]|jgi:hypothetical protein|nr:Ltp family lipoprotein [Lactobacillaceae bacterium]
MKKENEKLVFSLISLIIGIVALTISWVPLINNIAALFAIIGIILGLIAIILNRKHKKTIAIVGLVISILSFVIVLATQASYANAIDKAFNSSSSSKNNASLINSSKSKKATTSEKQSTPQEKAELGLQGNELARMKTAITYLKSSHLSKQDLYDQLTSEYGSKMTAEETNDVINKLDPLINWNNLAVLSAKSYRDSSYLTGQGLYDQLTSEYGSNFTAEQGQYAVEHIDDDVKSADIWN